MPMKSSPGATPSSCRDHIPQRTHSKENTSAPSAGSAGILGAGASDGSGGRKKCAELGARATEACGKEHGEEEARAGLNGLNGVNGLNGYRDSMDINFCSSGASSAREQLGRGGSARELLSSSMQEGSQIRHARHEESDIRLEETQIEKSSQEPSKMKEGVNVAVGWQGVGAQGVGGQGARRMYSDASILKAKTCSQAQSGADLCWQSKGKEEDTCNMRRRTHVCACRQSKGNRDVLAVLREKSSNVDNSPSGSQTRPMARVSSLGRYCSGDARPDYEDDKTLDTRGEAVRGRVREDDKTLNTLRNAPSSCRQQILQRTHSRENTHAPSAWPANNEDDKTWDTQEEANRGRVRGDDKTWDTLRNWAPPTPYVNLNKEKESYRNQPPGKRYNHQNVEEGGSLDGSEWKEGCRELGCRGRVRRTEVWPEMCGAIESSFLRAQTAMASAGLLPR